LTEGVPHRLQKGLFFLWQHRPGVQEHAFVLDAGDDRRLPLPEQAGQRVRSTFVGARVDAD
jgi:hypothetical protein